MRDRFRKKQGIHYSHLRLFIFAWIGGIVFAAFDRCGYMLKRYGTIWAVSENPLHRTIFHRILCRIPVSVLAVLVCLILVDVLRAGQTEKAGQEEKITRKIWLWLLYAVSFLPAFLGGFPGIFAADAPNQIGWTFSGWLTAHHPLLHTGILCAIFRVVRELGGSDTLAAAVYSLLQMAVLAWIFCEISWFLKKEKAPRWLQIGTALYLCLFPFHGMMAVYTTKDTIFSGLFVLCAIRLYRMCTEPEKWLGDIRKLVESILLFVLLFLFRNNGMHTLLLCMPFLLLFLRKFWKRLAVVFVCVLLTYSFCQGPMMTLLQAEPGNSREAYSILIQTLARTYVAGGEIREEEWEVIRPVMDEDTLALYTPNLSDPVKNHFHTEVFEENKGAFLKTWLQVGWRNKKIYVDAFLNTNAAFWYPDTEEEYLDFVCFDIEKDNPAYPHVEMKPISRLFYRYYTAVGTDAAFRNIPFIRELCSMGFYVWLMVFAAGYVLYKKEPVRLLWMLPFWTYLGTSMLGPAALLRYSYPIMLGAPFLLFVCVKKGKTERTEENCLLPDPAVPKEEAGEKED